jgi:hypothetical protein
VNLSLELPTKMGKFRLEKGLPQCKETIWTVKTILLTLSLGTTTSKDQVQEDSQRRMILIASSNKWELIKTIRSKIMTN